MGLAEKQPYTIDDIYALPEGERAELIDGIIYDMAPPSITHQRISNYVSTEINLYIRSNKGSCELFAAPTGVFLNDDNYNYVEPDLVVVCDRNKIKRDGVHGSPDWIAEIVSPGTRMKDSRTKLFKYRSAGIREYWIIDADKDEIIVNNFQHGTRKEYSFNDSVPVGIYDDFSIDFSKLDI